MKAKDIIDLIFQWVSKDLIDSWDNTGFQIGNNNKIVKKILIALDLDRKILDMAIAENFDMIISHHPLIFDPLKNITNESYKGNLIIDIIKNDIIVFNAHSNLDLLEDGINYHLAKSLGLQETEILSLSNIDIVESGNLEEEKSFGYGRVGIIEEKNLEGLIKLVKDKLELDHIIVYGNMDKVFKKIAICGGSGSDFIENAVKAGADLYITSDIKYHQAQLAYELGLTIFDIGHHNSERIILPIIKEYLEKNLDGEFIIKVVMESGLPHKIY